MNDYYYKMICTYIPNHELCVLNKNTRHILGYKKREKHLHLYMNICLHAGSICFRYCVCKVISDEELIYYYRLFTSSQPQN